MMNQEREDNKRINFAVLLSEVRFLVFFFTPEFLVLFTEQFCIVLPHHCLVQCILPSVFLHLHSSSINHHYKGIPFSVF